MSPTDLPTATEYAKATHDGLGWMIHFSPFSATEIGARHAELILGSEGHDQLRAIRDWARALRQAPVGIYQATATGCDLQILQYAATGFTA